MSLCCLGFAVDNDSARTMRRGGGRGGAPGLSSSSPFARKVGGPPSERVLTPLLPRNFRMGHGGMKKQVCCCREVSLAPWLLSTPYLPEGMTLEGI